MIHKKSYATPNGQVPTREGGLWASMRSRCIVGGVYQAKRPSYIGCRISEEFQDFQYFANWCHAQIGFDQVDPNGTHWQLDKDILGKGKLYSPQTCVFVPSSINGFLLVKRKNKDNLPIGVQAYKKGFKARCKKGNAQTHLGVFKTIEEAFNAYKNYKEQYAIELAITYAGRVDPRVVEFLMNYEVTRYGYAGQNETHE